jgi:hypothetical protein
VRDCSDRERVDRRAQSNSGFNLTR